QIELLCVAGAEIRRDPDHRSDRILAGGEVDCGRRGEAVADARSDRDVAGDYLIDRPERNVTLQPQKLPASAIRIVEQSISAADHGVGHSLIGEAEAWRPVLEVARDADAAVDAVYPGDQHCGGPGVEVGPAVGHLRIRAVVIPAQAEVQRQLAA